MFSLPFSSRGVGQPAATDSDNISVISVLLLSSLIAQASDRYERTVVVTSFGFI
jgi:hypothetical protein